jgi:hypothetical protein
VSNIPSTTHDFVIQVVTPLNTTRQDALRVLEDTLARGYDDETTRWLIVRNEGSRVIERKADAS